MQIVHGEIKKKIITVGKVEVITKEKRFDPVEVLNNAKSGDSFTAIMNNHDVKEIVVDEDGSLLEITSRYRTVTSIAKRFPDQLNKSVCYIKNVPENTEFVSF